MLIGLNLRPIMAAIGPLMKDIQTTILLSNSQASLLTTLPVAPMEICNLCSPWLLSYMDSKKDIPLGLFFVMVACLLGNFWRNSVALILTALLGGMGIAFIVFWNWNQRLYTYSGMVIPLLYTISMGTKYILIIYSVL